MSNKGNQILCACLVITMLAGLILLMPNATQNAKAIAPSTITFDTAADFDQGNKSDPGNTWFAQNGADQPSNGATSPRAWEANGILFTVWQGAGPSLRIYAASYTLATKTWTGPVTIVSSNPLNLDGHGSPSIAVTNDGFLHMFCCGHSSAILYYKSNKPYDISAWTLMNSFHSGNSPVSAQVSYPNVIVQSNGTMYVIHRQGNLGPAGFPTWAYQFSTDSGVTWKGPTTFVDFGVQRSLYLGTLEQVGNKVYFPLADLWNRRMSEPISMSPTSTCPPGMCSATKGRISGHLCPSPRRMSPPACA